MNQAVELSTWFDDSEYADLIVHYGLPTSRRSVHCHRVVVCPRSTFLHQACAAQATSDAVVKSDRRHFTALVDPLYDADSVRGVLRSLYEPTCNTRQWLEGKKWTELLPIFEVTRLFRLTELWRGVHKIIFDAICCVEDFKGIVHALEILETHKRKHPTSTRFNSGIAQLRCALAAARKEQMRTLRLLRHPVRRHEVPEQTYRKFLDAVKCSDWAQQMQACDDEADSDVDDGWQRSSD